MLKIISSLKACPTLLKIILSPTTTQLILLGVNNLLIKSFVLPENANPDRVISGIILKFLNVN